MPGQKSEAPAQAVVACPLIETPGFTLDAIGGGNSGIAKERCFPSRLGGHDLAALSLEVFEQ